MQNGPRTFLVASGSNGCGQLGNGTDVDSHMFTPCLFSHSLNCRGDVTANIRAMQDIACGGRHTLLLVKCNDTTGDQLTELWGCGDGESGQLGPHYMQAGHATSLLRTVELSCALQLLRNGYTYRLIAASWETSYVVLSCTGKSDILISMGEDDFGNVGIGNESNERKQDFPVHYANFDRILPPETFRFVVGAISAGLHHVIVRLNLILADGSTRDLTAGWGVSRHGQLGETTPVEGKTPRLISLDNAQDPVLSLGLGSQHSVLLHVSGRMSGLGSNRKNQLRGIENVSDVRALGCTWNGTYVMVELEGDIRMMATGSNGNGQLGRVAPTHPGSEDISLASVRFPFTSSTHRFVKMACGSEHVLALFEVISSNPNQEHETEVWGWGWNEHGNLGIGTTDDILLPQKIWPNTVFNNNLSGRETVVGIWAGCGTSWIVIRRST